MHLYSKAPRGQVARTILKFGQGASPSFSRPLFSQQFLPRLLVAPRDSRGILDLDFDEVSLLFRVFQEALAGDLSGKANVAKYARLLASKASQTPLSYRWRCIVQEHETLCTSLPAAESSFMSWELLCSEMEERTSLRIVRVAEEVRLAQNIDASGARQWGQAATRVISASLPAAQGSRGLQEYRKLLEASGYEIASRYPSSATPDRAQHKMEVEEKAMRLEQKSPRRDSLSGVHARIDEMMAAAPLGEEVDVFNDDDDDDEGMGVAQPAAALPVLNPADEEALKALMVQSRIALLSPQEQTAARACLASAATEEVLIEKFNIPITRRLMSALRPREWLNDEIINYYMCLLQERDAKLCAANPARKPSHYFNSFFISKILEFGTYNYKNVARWSKKFDVFSLRRVYFPININNNHWTMMVLHMEGRQLHFYDSMGGNGSRYMNAIMRWLQDEAKSKKGIDNYDVSTIELIDHGSEVPQQQNGFDCGAFSCIFADFDTDDLPFDFSQEHLPNWRLKMVMDILRGDLLYP